MSSTYEALKEKIKQERKEKYSTKEKMLETIRAESLLSQYVTVEEEKDGALLAQDHGRGLLLWLREREDGSVELSWAEVGRPIHARKEYEDPVDGYAEFASFVWVSNQALEEERAKHARRGGRLNRLIKKVFGKREKD